MSQPEPAAPTLTTCNCRWDGDQQVQQCTLHEAHVQAIHEWAERAKAAEAKAAPTVVEPGERTTQVLNDLQSALGMMLTFFGMDEDENSKSVFDTARQAHRHAQIVLRPIEPHEREALANLRSTLHRWHKSAVAKGFDGVAALLDSVTEPSTVVPVAWQIGGGGHSYVSHEAYLANGWAREEYTIPLYATPPRAPTVVEPVGVLHPNGGFTWKRREDSVLDKQLPCDFYLAPPSATPPRAALTDEQAEALIESSDGRWHEDEFRIDSRDLMALLRKAHGIAASEGGAT